MGTYYIVLSCDEIFVEGRRIQEYLEEIISKKDISIECISKHDDLESSKCEIDELEGSCVYVVNTNEEPDYVNFWELGYAMGKGFKIIGYSEGENEIKIPEDMKNLIRPISKDINQFVKRIRLALPNLTAKEVIIKKIEKDEWDRQTTSAKKEFKGEN